MITETRHIDLHLPRSWNQCTTDELEQIAAVIALRTLRTDRYHPFDMLAAKVEILFALNKLEIVSHGEDSDIVRFIPAKKKWWQRRKEEEPFELSVAAVHSMITDYLTWLDAEDAEPLLRVPYPSMTIHGREYMGPTPMLDGFLWEEYRHLQDWMQIYTDLSNRLLKLMQQHRDELFVKGVAEQVTHARSEILAILFRPESGEKKSSDFNNFDDIKWQVILFWYSGLMKYLQKQYSRCFKPQKPGRQSKRQNPLELYTRTTATMEKYIGLNEREVNHQSFHVILQHMEDMAKEAEEMKRMNSKYKKKK